jgi:IS30 family transposase
MGRFNDAISIRDRPAEVEDPSMPGQWKGDLIAGSGNAAQTKTQTACCDSASQNRPAGTALNRSQ